MTGLLAAKRFEVVSVNDLRRRPKTDQDGARLYYAAESTCGNVDMSTFTQGRSDPPVKPTSEVAHQPGQQPAAQQACDFCKRQGIALAHIWICGRCTEIALTCGL